MGVGRLGGERERESLKQNPSPVWSLMPGAELDVGLNLMTLRSCKV